MCLPVAKPNGKLEGERVLPTVPVCQEPRSLHRRTLAVKTEKVLVKPGGLVSLAREQSVEASLLDIMRTIESDFRGEIRSFTLWGHSRYRV